MVQKKHKEFLVPFPISIFMYYFIILLIKSDVYVWDNMTINHMIISISLTEHYLLNKINILFK